MQIKVAHYRIIENIQKVQILTFFFEFQWLMAEFSIILMLFLILKSKLF
jgi:hypothetical protein